MGDRRKADSVFREFERRFPDGLSGTQRVADLVGRGEISAAGTLARSGYERDGSDPYQRVVFSDALRGLSERRGLIAEANEWSKRSADARAEFGAKAAGLLDAAATAERLLLAFGDTIAAVKGLDAALSATPIESLELLDRPYFEVGTALADAGHVARAKSFVAGIERQYPPNDLDNGYKVHALRARIAMAERRWSDAVRELPPDLPARCSLSCAEVPRAAAYDGAGNADSALIWYERQAMPTGLASLNLVMTYRRMGELYAAKNEIGKAIDWYQKFVDAWKDAEPRLQPQVSDVRRRIVRLKEQERRSR